MWVYLNGKILKQEEVVISPFDRGFQFSDGAYEVIRYYPKKFFELNAHLNRLKYSLKELLIPIPSLNDIEPLLNELIIKNNLTDEPSIAYLQVTRGIQYPRRHSFDDKISHTLFISTERFPAKKDQMISGVKVGLGKDIRWLRCDIKSTSLIPSVLSSHNASQKGYFETIYHREGIITEGAHTSVCFVAKNELIIPKLSNLILAGITRRIVLEICHQEGIRFSEKDISITELNNFAEIMLLGTTTEITPVIGIDGIKINQGIPGPVCRLLQSEYQKLLL